MAIRAGACATIVGGVTRDQEKVKNLNFPVFSQGYNCQDVRKRATLESINQKITLKNVDISPSDLIFADSDGIVVIPRQIKEKVIALLLEKLQMENKVTSEICKMKNPLTIVKEVGEF